MKTNHEAKQEAIKAAWGDAWDKVKERIHRGGWYNPLLNENHINFGFKRAEVEYGNVGIFRPIALHGIHDNNGWTRIQPDRSNLPTTEGHYEFLSIDGDRFKTYFKPGCSVSNLYRWYTPIQEKAKPIY